MLRVALGAFVIGRLWFLNARKASQPVPLGWLAYAAGSSVGAVVGQG